jgi:transposase
MIEFGTQIDCVHSVPGQLTAVTVVDPSPLVPAPVASAPPGVIVLSVGQAQLRLEGQIDTAMLTLLLTRLLP